MKHSRHALRYVDLYPEPVEREPSLLAQVIGGIVAAAALYLVTVFLFSL